MPNINYGAASRRQRNAPDALSDLSSNDRFRMNSFISMLDTLKVNLRRAIVYSDIAKVCLFLANLKATKLEIVRDVKLLEETYPEDVDPKLIDELLHVHLYVRLTQSQGLAEEQSISLSNRKLYQLICRKKFTLPFLMWKHYLDYF